MQNLRINIVSSEADQRAGSFSLEFKEDLQKCLSRFHKDFALFDNSEPNADQVTMLVISSQTQLSEGNEKFSHLIQNPNTIPVFIEPANNLTDSIKQPFHFWDKQLDTGETRLFRCNNDQTKVNYWETMTDLAIEVSQNYSGISIRDKQEAIYLSQDDISFNAERENIKRDLNDLGYKVLPSESLSDNYTKCSQQIYDALEESKLIIQIVPPIYNIQFADYHLSLCELQCNLAAQLLRDAERTVNRIIWIPSGYEITDEENQVFIEKLQRDPAQTIGTTVLKTSIEELKKHYRHLLVTGNSISQNDDSCQVYLIEDGSNKGVADEAKITLEHQNLTVTTNTNGLTYSQHLNNLAQASIVVICYSGSNDQWLRVKGNDILKSKGLDSARPLEKIMLLKTTDYPNTLCDDIFTDIVSSPKELASIQTHQS